MLVLITTKNGGSPHLHENLPKKNLMPQILMILLWQKKSGGKVLQEQNLTMRAFYYNNLN